MTTPEVRPDSAVPVWGNTAAGAPDLVEPTAPEVAAGWPLSPTPASRGRWNWALKYLFSGVRYLLQRGLPEWDAAETYPANAFVQKAGATYKSAAATTGNDPAIDDGSHWVPWGSTAAAVQAAYPVGSVYINAGVGTNPNTLFGFGTWVAFGTGRVLVGVDGSQAEFATLGQTGGEKTHVLTVGEMPAHTHPTIAGDSGGATGSPGYIGTGAGALWPSGSTGGGGAHNNLQPYITVYMWKRTA